jgi:hypothetical protein
MFLKSLRATKVKMDTAYNYVNQRYDVFLEHEKEEKQKITSMVMDEVEEMCRSFSNTEVIKLGKRVLLFLYAVKCAKDAVYNPAIDLSKKQNLIQFATYAFVINIKTLDCSKIQSIYVQKAEDEIKKISGQCNFVPKKNILR